MTILETLKKLHKKITGKDATSKSISGILTSLEENYTGSGDTGPTVTYEPFATITIDNDVTNDGVPAGLKVYTTDFSLTIPENAELYFESQDYPLTKQILDLEGQGNEQDFQYHYIYGGNINTYIFEDLCYDLAYFVNANMWVIITSETFEQGDEINILQKITSSSSGGADLPDPGTAGNVLTSTGTGWESAAPQSGLPDTTGASVGDVVTLGESGAEWATPQTDDTMYLDTLQMGLGDAITVPGAPEWAYCYSISSYSSAISALYDEKADLRIYTTTYHDGEKVTLIRGSACWTHNCTISAQGIDRDDPNEDAFAIVENADLFVSSVDLSRKTITVEKKNVLPYVNASDNGQLLGVNGGAFTLVDNTAPFIVNLTLNNNTWATDKTVAEILAAENAGRFIVCHAAYVLGEGASGFTFPRVEAFVVSELAVAPEYKYNMMVAFFDTQVEGNYVYRVFTADATTDYMTAADS